MKVTFVTTSFPAYKGHIQSPFIYQLAKHIAKQNVDLTVITPNYKKSLKKQETLEGMKIKRFTYFIKPIQTLTEKGNISSFMKNPYAFIQMVCYLISMFFTTLKYSKNADVIHCQWALSGLVGVAVNKIRKKKLIVTLRGEDLTALQKPLMKPVFKYVMKNADCVTSNNEELVKVIKQYAKQSMTIKNGIDTQIFKQRSKELIRKKLQLPKNKQIILFVGWINERKGLKYLIEAMPYVLKNNPETLLLVVGKGPLQEKLQKRVRDLTIKNKVFFVGEKNPEEVADYMSAADLLVLPSLCEGLPNVVLEAFSAGLAVIATDVGGTKEIVQNNKTGFLIQSKNTKQIIEKTNQLLQKPILSKKFVTASKKLLQKQNLTWPKSAKLHIELYKKL
tara:strand:+ start:13302 stop:14474 length:1173 start_codon:yes stop_codon:yes gene_type:complete